MKKLFMFLAVAGLATFGASCSKSDDSKPEEVKALVLSPDKSAVKVGESVTFTSKVDGKDVAGADIYVAGVKSANPYKFDKEGTFDVVSKKTGFKDSNTVKITVTKGEPEPVQKTLVLSADKLTGFVGDSVTFAVKVDGKDETGFDIYVDGTKGTNPYKFDKEGTFKVVAKKANFKDSNEVSIVITKKNTDLALTADKTSVKVGDKVTFTVKNGGNVVADATLKLNGATVTSPWTATAEGTYKFTATKTGFNTSNEVTVVVEKAPVVPTGNVITVGAKTLQITKETLAVEVNANGAPILYSADTASGKMYYIVYRLYSDVDVANNTFGFVEFAAVVPAGTAQLVWPQDALALLEMDGLVAENGALLAEMDENDTTVKLNVAKWSTVKPTQTTPGTVKYTFVSQAFNINYDGDYSGLSTFKAPANKGNNKLVKPNFGKLSTKTLEKK